MKTVFWLCLFFASNVYAQVSYLECEVSGRKTIVGNSGSDEKLTNQKIVVTVLQNKQALMIAGEGPPDYIFSGSTKELKGDQEFKASNRSTDSGYFLEASSKKSNGAAVSVDIAINKVTGSISVSKATLIGSYLVNLELGGFCKKIPSGNKF